MKHKTLGFSSIIALALCWPAAAQTYDTNNDVVETFAGSGFSGWVDGTGQQTMFNYPWGLVADSSNNLYVCDTEGTPRVRKITPSAVVSTFAGGGTAPTGFGTNVSLYFVTGGEMTIDHSDNLLIVGGPTGLYKISPNALVSSVPLTGISSPGGVCVDSKSNVFISDYSAQKIFRLDTIGTIAVFAGSGNTGSADGNGIFTSFNRPTMLAVDAADNIYVWDQGSSLLRRIDPSENVVTLTSDKFVNSDGFGTNASFSLIYGMCVDDSGNLILACEDNYALDGGPQGGVIREMTPTTNVLTLAGSFTQSGYTNGAGNVALFNLAGGVCFAQGSIFVADTDNQRIRQITFNPQAQPVSGASLGIAAYAGLTITGTVGRTYQIQTSADMNSWSTIATLLLNSSPYVWIDQNALIGDKFYRALLLP
jgi:hypothetical protein